MPEDEERKAHTGDIEVLDGRERKEKEREQDTEEGGGKRVSIFPPIYLMHGTEDTTVPISASQRFNQELRISGQRTALKLYQGIGHADLALGLMDAKWSFHHSIFEEVLHIIRTNSSSTANNGRESDGSNPLTSGSDD